MKRIGTTSLMLFCIWSLIFGQVPAWDWVNAIHSPNTEIATDMAADPLTGDVYLVGDWEDTLAATIPSGGSESTDFTATFGGVDGFVVKLDRNQKINNNNVVLTVQNQYGEMLPFFVIPIGGVPVYNPKIRMRVIER